METRPLRRGNVLFTDGNAAARTFGRAHRHRPYHFSCGSVSQGRRKRLCRWTKTRKGCRKRLRRWTKMRKVCRRIVRRRTKTRKGCRRTVRRWTKTRKGCWRTVRRWTKSRKGCWRTVRRRTKRLIAGCRRAHRACWARRTGVGFHLFYIVLAYQYDFL